MERRQLSKKEYENVSGAMIMTLRQGDKVWLEADVETEEPDQAEVIIYFSGFLISSWNSQPCVILSPDKE